METRAHFVLIGMVTISLIVGGFLFVLWLASVEIDQEFTSYDIIFESAVTGLSEAGDVRYSGIKVGEVSRLTIDPNDPSRVIARIRADATTPVSVDTKATLEFQGLTGVSYIQLSGGGPQSAKLQASEGQEVASILAEPSVFETIFSGAPDVLASVGRAALMVQQILGPENQQSATSILASIDTITGTVAEHSDDISALIVNAERLSADLADSTDQIKSLTTGLNELLERDGEALVSEARRAVTSVGDLADNANGILDDNSASLRSFSDEGLAQFGVFVVEARQLVRTLDRVLERFDSDPARYLSGNQAAGYAPE